MVNNHKYFKTSVCPLGTFHRYYWFLLTVLRKRNIPNIYWIHIFSLHFRCPAAQEFFLFHFVFNLIFFVLQQCRHFFISLMVQHVQLSQCLTGSSMLTPWEGLWDIVLPLWGTLSRELWEELLDFLKKKPINT